jgi:hypothetical protein
MYVKTPRQEEPLPPLFGSVTVAIRALLEADQEKVFSSKDIATVTSAFEAILRGLGLTDCETDPAVMMIAKLTIDIAKQGERDPKRLSETVLKLVSSK